MSGPAELRMMSFNIRYDTPKDGPNRWRHRREAAFEVVRAFDPDVLGLQEALPRQLDDWDAALPGYARASCGRDGPETGEAVALYVREEAYRIVQSGGFWLSETPEAPSLGWDASLPRVVAWAALEGRGTRLRVAVTHLDHLGPESRRRAAEVLVRWVGGRGPAVVLGDFNAPPDGPAHQALVEGGLVDTYRAVHAEASGPTFHDFGAPFVDARIDWILATDDLEVRAADVVRTRPGAVWPSDHYPVTAVLRP